MRLVISRRVPDKRLPIPKRAEIRQPSMFLAGTLDGLNLVAQPSPESMRSNLSDLRSFIMLDGVGRWPQLEAPMQPSAALLEFLRCL
jgi:pimeloyl-ACP methyl ester carboxylesterase